MTKSVDAQTPFAPPRTVAIAPCGGHIGPQAEHFEVEELPAYPLSGDGEHLFLWVEKTGRTTTEVAQRIARAAGVRPRDVGYAGMKDKIAITRQWFSLCSKEKSPAAWDLGDDARVLDATRHKNKLRTGHLAGNRFRITLVDVPSGGAERADEIAAQIRSLGLPNYFGQQRFGRDGRNLHEAHIWLDGLAGPGDPPKATASPHSDRSPTSDNDQMDGHRRRRRGPGTRFANKMLPSVLQSEVFNRYTAARLAAVDLLLKGEVVRLGESSRCFTVEDVDAELPRLVAGEIHRTGPMPGPKTLQASGAPLELEERILGELGLTAERRKALETHAPGARRDLLIHPENLEATAPSTGTIVLEFSLRAGGYATQVAREFSGAHWSHPRGL